MQRFLLIVARGDSLIHETLTQVFADYPDVDVILDRRYAERRRWTFPLLQEERRARDRRFVNVEAHLRREGWVVVEQRSAREGGG